MDDDFLTVRVLGDGGRTARALREQRVRVVDGEADVVLVVRPQPSPGDAGLTSRELDVLAQLSLGATNGEIAETLFIAENTVKNHVRSILLKLSARSRTEAVVLAHRRGLLHLDHDGP